MQQYPYWQKQTQDKPLYPDIAWSKPEQRARAGKLAIIGGHSGSFVAVAESYQLALQVGIGQARVIIPDSLKKVIPPVMTDVILSPSNPSGGFSQESSLDITAAAAWADHILLIGDNGRNPETAIVYEQLLKDSTTPITITRDAFDLLKFTFSEIAEREHTTLVLSFAQVQNLFRGVYYPKVLSLSMQLTLFVEALHKFTLTYPCTIVTFHSNQLIVAHNGHISTTSWNNPMAIWRGNSATKASVYLVWNKSKPFEAITTGITS